MLNQVDVGQGQRSRSLLELCAVLAGVIVYTSANGFMTGGLTVAGRQLGLGEVQVGLILGSGALIGVIAAPVWGFVTDVWDRRRLLLLAVSMVTIGPAAMAVITGKLVSLLPLVAGGALAAARLTQAVFGAALIPAGQAYMAKLTHSSRRVSGMGILSAAISSGTLLGSLLLWLTGQFSVASGFAIIALLGVMACAAIAAFTSKEVFHHEPSSRAFTLPYRKLWRYFAMTLIGFTCYTTVPPIFAVRLMDRHGMDAAMAVTQTGLVLTIGVFAVCLSQVFIAIQLKWRPAAMLRWGSVGIFVGLLFLLQAESLVGMCLAMGLIGFAVGFLAPAILGAISLISGDGDQGKIGGLNMAARGLGSAIGPVLGTMLYQQSPDAPIFGSLVLIIGVFSLTFFLSAENENGDMLPVDISSGKNK
ncbi:MFS transporter [Brucella intermedia]|uniref:MFS transporter n=1 Tax=Brucella intermedia TaxID=94625 RepID=UPI00165D13E7|nr:MFS transporter [Brucella intermedia]QNQ42420.1 MFS transporter [Brucella intermedia]